MCTLDLLPEIISAGVTSLKIEGRMKQPGYTAAVTGMYRKYLDILLNTSDPYHVTDQDRQYLLDIFSRGGSCQGYYRQSNGPSMMAFTNDKKSNGIPEALPSRKEPVSGTLILYPGAPAMLDISCRDAHITATAEEVQFAKDQPMAETRIRQQMEKLGNTPFIWNSLNIEMGEQIFVPIRVLNELRRNAIQLLEERLYSRQKRTVSGQIRYSTAKNAVPSEQTLRFRVSCETREQAAALCKNPEIYGLYVYYDALKELINSDIYKEKELYLSLPYITRGSAPKGLFDSCRLWLSDGRLKGFLVRNLETYGMLRELGLQKYCILDASMYTWNDEAISFWENENILRNTLPYELNEKELLHRNNIGSEMILYGSIPLMLSAQCVRKNTQGCDCNEQSMVLKDRYDKEFCSICVCHPWKTGTTAKEKHCYNILYNSLPLGLLQEADKVRNLGIRNFRLNFTTEAPAQAAKILQEFLDVYLHHKIPAERNYTKGHFKRGAE